MFFRIKKNQYYIEDDENINCIILYGSWARSENDTYSDIDILIITENNSINSYKIIDKEGNIIPEKWITIYSKENIEKMKCFTSLFLWHIKLEGIVLYQSDNYINEVLCELPEYTGCKEDIRQYKVICQDIKDLMLREEYTSLYFELSLLGSLVRNIAIAYCYSSGKKVFGRIEPIELLLRDHPLFALEEYKELYKFRSNYNNFKMRKIDKIKNDFIIKWIRIIEKLVKLMEEKYG